MSVAAPTAATIITSEDVQKAISLAPNTLDHTVRVIDMGQNYNMSVAILNHGPTSPPPKRTPEQTAAAAAANAKLKDCGVSAPDGKIDPTGMLVHNQTAETYVVIKGEGTLLTGGKILQGKMLPADNVVTFNNGPSCSGKATGNFTARHIKMGDVVVIPAGVPHGWSDVPKEVDYLSIRPDPDHVLPEAGYKYPGL